MKRECVDVLFGGVVQQKRCYESLLVSLFLLLLRRPNLSMV